MTLEELLHLAQVMRAAGASAVATPGALRVEGASQVESVFVLRELEGVRLGVAKELLDKSLIWADTRDLNASIRRGRSGISGPRAVAMFGAAVWTAFGWTLATARW